jgi:hypothetical protein
MIQLLCRLYEVNQVVFISILFGKLAIFEVLPDETILLLRLRGHRRLIEVY